MRALRAIGASTRGGEEETRSKRPADGDDHERDGKVADEHVLRHVRRQQLVVRDAGRAARRERTS